MIISRWTSFTDLGRRPMIRLSDEDTGVFVEFEDIGCDSMFAFGLERFHRELERRKDEENQK